MSVCAEIKALTDRIFARNLCLKTQGWNNSRKGQIRHPQKGAHRSPARCAGHLPTAQICGSAHVWLAPGGTQVSAQWPPNVLWIIRLQSQPTAEKASGRARGLSKEPSSFPPLCRAQFLAGVKCELLAESFFHQQTLHSHPAYVSPSFVMKVLLPWKRHTCSAWRALRQPLESGRLTVTLVPRPKVHLQDHLLTHDGLPLPSNLTIKGFVFSLSQHLTTVFRSRTPSFLLPETSEGQ